MSDDAILRRLFSLATFAFILSTLFDPADRMFGLKVPLFISCWGLGVVVVLGAVERVRLPIGLVIYVATIVTIPVISVGNYFFTNASYPFEGFQLLKAYLFVSLSILLYITRTDLLPQLSVALTLLSVSVLAVAGIVLLVPDLFLPIYLFGNQFGMFSVDNRDYGSGLVLFQMYFVTSPMLAIAVAYYFQRAVLVEQSRNRSIALAIVNLIALVVAGSRNNLIAAILLPLALVIIYSRQKLTMAAIATVVAATAGVLAWEQIGILFNPNEISNSAKLTLLMDYLKTFENSTTLLLGQGLGAYQNWSGRSHYYISELTYLEIIRNFGILLGAVMIFLLVYPVIHTFLLRRARRESGIVAGYSVYLFMCISNPNLFSSMGMLILSILIANRHLADPTPEVPAHPQHTPRHPAPRSAS